MTKLTMLRLPDKTAEKIQKIADKKGLPFATYAKELICESLSKIKKDRE
jgi:predicted DNA-binding protein